MKDHEITSIKDSNVNNQSIRNWLCSYPLFMGNSNLRLRWWRASRRWLASKMSPKVTESKLHTFFYYRSFNIICINYLHPDVKHGSFTRQFVPMVLYYQKSCSSHLDSRLAILFNTPKCLFLFLLLCIAQPD